MRCYVVQRTLAGLNVLAEGKTTEQAERTALRKLADAHGGLAGGILGGCWAGHRAALLRLGLAPSDVDEAIAAWDDDAAEAKARVKAD